MSCCAEDVRIKISMIMLSISYVYSQAALRLHAISVEAQSYGKEKGYPQPLPELQGTDL